MEAAVAAAARSPVADVLRQPRRDPLVRAAAGDQLSPGRGGGPDLQRGLSSPLRAADRARRGWGRGLRDQSLARDAGAVAGRARVPAAGRSGPLLLADAAGGIGCAGP